MTDEELATFIRFWLGGLTEEDISTEDLQTIIDMTRSQYPEATDCQLKYYATVNTLNWFIRKGSTSESTGEVKSREEQRGKTKIKVEYDVGSATGDGWGWAKTLEDLEKDPNSIGCVVFPDGKGLVVIGVTKGRFETVAPWRQNLTTPTRKLW